MARLKVLLSVYFCIVRDYVMVANRFLTDKSDLQSTKPLPLASLLANLLKVLFL